MLYPKSSEIFYGASTWATFLTLKPICEYSLIYHFKSICSSLLAVRFNSKVKFSVDDRSSLAQFAKLIIFKLTCCAQQEKRRKTIPNLSGHDERMHVGGPIEGGRAAAAVARRRTVVRRRRRRGASVPRPKVPRARTDVRATAVEIITITHRLVSLSLSVTIPLPGRLWFRPCRHNWSGTKFLRWYSTSRLFSSFHLTIKLFIWMQIMW